MSLAESVRDVKVNHNITQVVLVNNVAKTIDTVVPALRRWVIMAIKAFNIDNVDRAITISVYSEAAKTNQLAILAVRTVAQNQTVSWPNTLETDRYMSPGPVPYILDAGNVISVTWSAGGASAGGTDDDGLIISVLEVGL